MAALLVLAAGAATATVPDDKPNIVPPPSPTGSSQGEAKAAKAAPPIATRPLLHLADTPGDTVGLLWNAAQRRNEVMWDAASACGWGHASPPTSCATRSTAVRGPTGLGAG